MNGENLLASMENIQGSAFVLGMLGVITGVVLFNIHQRMYHEAVGNESDARVRRFETRKFRRRVTVAAMVASTGCLMAALYWVTEVRIFAIFILLIMTMLIGILGIAVIDMFSVSLQALTRTDETERRKVVEDYLRKREQAAAEDSDSK